MIFAAGTEPMLVGTTKRMAPLGVRWGTHCRHWAGAVKFIPGGGHTRGKPDPWRMVPMPDAGMLFYLDVDPGERNNIT